MTPAKYRSLVARIRAGQKSAKSAKRSPERVAAIGSGIVENPVGADAIAAVELRDARRVGGWSYLAVMYDEYVPSYAGAARRTEYFRYDGGWRSIAWNSIPPAVYRQLRARLRYDAAEKRRLR